MAAHKGFTRTHFFIDRRLQGRYAVTFLVPMLVMLVFMVFTLVVASRSIASSAARMMREDIDTRVTAALQDRADASVEDYAVVLRDIDRDLRGFASSTRYRKTLMGPLLWVFGLGILVVIVEIVLLTVYFSHRVAGPIYRLEKVCRGVLEGDYTVRVSLRKGDELQNLAGLLGRAIDATRGRLVALRDESDEQRRKAAAAELKLRD